jgi:hypothetical protein
MRKTGLVVTTLALTLRPMSHGATPPTWTQTDAEERLQIGRFAARHGVDDATCLGSGRVYRREFSKQYRQFECKLEDRDFDTIGQVVVTVTGQTTYKVRWLAVRDCRNP